MRALLLEAPRTSLKLAELPIPRCNPKQVLIRVDACAVCRTDLHIVDGELPLVKTPLVLGHQVVGTITAKGEHAEDHAIGDRVGVPWLGEACGVCRYCRRGRENLCDSARFTGYVQDGGYAEYCVADARYCFPVPEGMGAVEAAPLLCAGLIGYRAWRMIGDAESIGFYGFGAAARLLMQVAACEGKRVYAFTRPGKTFGQHEALTLGAVWAGGSDEMPPGELDAAILFAPVGELVPKALQAVTKGGTVVCAEIHMSDIPSLNQAASRRVVLSPRLGS